MAGTCSSVQGGILFLSEAARTDDNPRIPFWPMAHFGLAAVLPGRNCAAAVAAAGGTYCHGDA